MNMIVTDRDRDRILELLDRLAGDHASRDEPWTRLLFQLLRNARTMPSDMVPRGVATLHSRVSYRVLPGPMVSTVTLVQPAEADPTLGRESILSPIGSAIFGLSEGQRIDWPCEDRQRRSYMLVRVVFQPEAAGRYDL